jgi:hypothetical protein
VAAATAQVPGPTPAPQHPVLPEEPPRANRGGPEVAAGSTPPSPARSRPQPIQVEPLTADLRRIHVTVSRRLVDKLSAARDALSHSDPGASEDEIIEVGLDLILKVHAKRRGLVAKPRRPSPAPSVAPALEATSAAPNDAAPGAAVSTSGSAEHAVAGSPPGGSKRSRYVPAHVAREVWKRDEGRCQWPIDGGGICGATYQVEMDHVPGFALGAGHTAAELRLLCRVHQDVHARRLYGDDLMDKYTRPKGGGCSEPVAEYAAGHRSSSCEARAV